MSTLDIMRGIESMCDHCDMMRHEWNSFDMKLDRRSFRKRKCLHRVKFGISKSKKILKCQRESGHRGACLVLLTGNKK